MNDSTQRDELLKGDGAFDDDAAPAVADSALDDQELERLLTDAYPAPPVPKSLLGRIDRAVAAEWGESPCLVQRPLAEWVNRWLSRGSRLRRAVPVAGTLAAIVVIAVIFSSGGTSYAWSSVLDALDRHGVVEITGDAETRLLSLSEGVVSVRHADNTRWIDLRQRVQLDRRADSTEVFRRPLPVTTDVASDSLVFGFLTGDAGLEGESAAFRKVRVIEEKWSRIGDSGDRISLCVTFEVADREPVTLKLTLDPQTKLPLACQVIEGAKTTASVTLSYQKTDVASVRQREFPPELVVVELDARGERLLAQAGAESNDGPAEKIATQRKKNQIAANDAAAGSTVPAPEVKGARALFDAPSKWPAVEPVAGSRHEIVQKADAILSQLWQQNGVTPARPAGEEELLRRVYLDLVGRTPSVTEVREFLADKSPQKYEAIVDRLLRSPDHASHLATVWRSFLIPEGVDLTAFGGVQEFDRWLADRFASDESYDKIVRGLLLAEGRLSRSGPLLFYTAVKLDPEQLAARTSRVFLGMRLECAQCHDHPFEPWAQEEFWGLAAFFAQISRPRGKLEKVSSLMQVRDIDRGDVMLPNSQTVVAPAFLDGAVLPEGDRDAARRRQLAVWLTSRQNPYFARATANRVWGQMFGKGIVDPVDDFGTQHQPVSAELLNLLAGHFVATDFSLRELFRTVALSAAYRLSSGADTQDPKRVELFGQMHVKTLTAEQVYDCITVATLLDSQAATPDGLNLNRIANTSRDQFVRQFKTPAGHTTEYLGGIPQALTLMNGALISGATGLQTSGLLKSLEAPFFTNEQRVEVLYLATL